jgi:glycerol-3-phosphate acyltransferase PlsY
MNLAVALLIAYLVGAIPTSWIVAKLGAGVDLREVGSKNLGATNLFRTLGWKYAVPAGLFDVAKGAAPVAVLSPRVGTAGWIPLVIGLGAIVGHVFSVFVKFRGGKGVATAAGVVLALAPVALLASAVVWLVVLRLTGFVSLASMTGAVTFPIAAWLIQPNDRWVGWFGVAVAAFILFNHRSNIARLRAGTESRFGRHGAS